MKFRNYDFILAEWRGGEGGEAIRRRKFFLAPSNWKKKLI